MRPPSSGSSGKSLCEDLLEGPLGCPRVAAFLTSEWHDVLGVTYAVDEALLQPYLPRGAEIDALDGSPRVSLVAFGFRHTRVRGIPIPGHIAFPEINLRFYVCVRGERGVVFIREYVPRPAVSLVAKLVYNEPYRTTRMEHVVTKARDALHVRHRFGRSKRSLVEAIAGLDARLPDPDGPEHWLTHHELGIGRTRDGRARGYRVEHELWALHDILTLNLDVDFGGLYGPRWAPLAEAEPSHVTLASGSEVRVLSPDSPTRRSDADTWSRLAGPRTRSRDGEGRSRR